mmetsp:Transcript_18803/g.56832  ORF Transcript_18803/g.56832 Transcript_18803/m.56832 type:complete len:727 (+) Transcript_18803:119-2299(+)
MGQAWSCFTRPAQPLEVRPSMGRVEILPAKTEEEEELASLMELGLTIVIEHLLTSGICPPALFAPVCRAWRDEAIKWQPDAHLQLCMVGNFEFKQQVRGFAKILKDPRYAEGGERPLGALALAHTTPLETRAAVPPPGPGGPTGPRERHTWDAGRLIACADLLCSIPTCCRVLVLNGGAAEGFQGLRKLLALTGNGAMSMARRVPLLAAVEVLVMEHLPPSPNMAPESLAGYLAAVGLGADGIDHRLKQLHLTRHHFCCSSTLCDCLYRFQVPDVVELAPVLPRFQAVESLTLDGQDGSNPGETTPLLDALLELPALRELRMRHSIVSLWLEKEEHVKLQLLMCRLELLDLEGTQLRQCDGASGVVALGKSTTLRSLTLPGTCTWSLAEGLPRNLTSLALLGHEDWDRECLEPLTLPPSLRRLRIEDLWDVSFAEGAPPAGLQVHLYLASNPSGSSEQHSATHAQYARQLHINQLTWVYHDPTQDVLPWAGINVSAVREAQLLDSRRHHGGLLTAAMLPNASHLRRLDMQVCPAGGTSLDLSQCTQLTWLRFTGNISAQRAEPTALREGSRGSPWLPEARLPATIECLHLAHLMVPNEAALGAWLQQVPRLARLQLADCWVVHQVGPNPRLAQLEGLVPDSGLPATLEELRLFPWPAPPPHRDGTGVERYMHLLEYPRLRSFTLWPAPGRLATSDFKLLQGMLSKPGARIKLNTTDNFLDNRNTQW